MENLNKSPFQSVIWIAGCGDIGIRLSKRYDPAKFSIHGMVRSKESEAKCQLAGITTLLADFNEPLDFDPQQLTDAQLFYFAPPPPQGKVDTSLARFLEHIGAAPKSCVLISTTGVYGDCDGAWIDENAQLKPGTDRARRRLDAETRLTDWGKQYQKEIIILRVPGIYATDRLPIERIKKGLPVLNQEESPFTNRIHADDLAMVCQAAMQTAKNGSIYNVTDSDPSTMTEYFNDVADYAGLPRPPQVSLKEANNVMSAGMLSYLQESRRISNKKLLQELNIQLQYPSIRDALIPEE